MRSQFPLLYALLAAGSLSLTHGAVSLAETNVRALGGSSFKEASPTIHVPDQMEYVHEPVYHASPSYVMEGPHTGKLVRPHLRHGIVRPHAGLHLGMHKACHPLHTMDSPNPWHWSGPTCSTSHGCGGPVVGSKWGLHKRAGLKPTGLGLHRKLVFGGVHHGLRHGQPMITDHCGCGVDSGMILGTPYEKGWHTSEVVDPGQPSISGAQMVPTPGNGDPIPVPPDPDAT